MTVNKIERRSFLLGSTLLLGACSVGGVTKVKTFSDTVPLPVQDGEADSNRLLRIFASSGFSKHREDVDLALSRFRNAGFVIDNEAAAYRRDGRFAGSDIQRANDFQDLVKRHAKVPKMLLAFRGGYGAIRILPRVDWARLASVMKEHGTLLVGFSDVTAIQLALLAKGKMVSFSGPMLVTDFGKPAVSPFMVQNFINCISQPSVTISGDPASAIDSLIIPPSVSRPIEGIFWGGNLSLLLALIDTPYMPVIKGGILFIEEINEHIYRIESMLQTLYLAGILSQQKAIVFGALKPDEEADEYDPNFTIASIVNRLQKTIKIPIFTGFRFGHMADKVTMPVGAPARISLNSEGYQIQFSHYPFIKAAGLNLAALGESFAPPPASNGVPPSNLPSGSPEQWQIKPSTSPSDL